MQRVDPVADVCDLCEVGAGRTPTLVVYEDAGAVAFLAKWPTRRVHTVIIPRVHVADMADEGAADAVANMSKALEAASRMLFRGLGADDVSLVQSNGSAAGQEVFHLRMHLIPRWHGDSPLKSWGHDCAEGDRIVETHRQVLGLA